MRVFVTGASGHVASALVPELIANGHEVTGLARSDASAEAVEALGATVHRGDLTDLDGLRAAASEADGVVHLAFVHDFADYGEAAAIDLHALEAMGEALAGTGKPIVATSGTLGLALFAPGRVGTEDDAGESGPRIDSENLVVGLADRDVRSSVVRLPPIVHSDLDHHGFTHQFISTARAKGVSAYVGEGANRWPAVHTRDAARLFRLALESAPAGSRLHAVHDGGIPLRAIAASIGQHLGVPVESIPAEQAMDHFGFLGMPAQLDNPVSAAKTEELLHWHPQEVGLLRDLEGGHYFAEPSS